MMTREYVALAEQAVARVSRRMHPLPIRGRFAVELDGTTAIDVVRPSAPPANAMIWCDLSGETVTSQAALVRALVGSAVGYKVLHRGRLPAWRIAVLGETEAAASTEIAALEELLRMVLPSAVTAR